MLRGSPTFKRQPRRQPPLHPLAGDFAFILFALGILGVGLIGVPVLAGSAAYALAEAMGWKSGLERRATDARGFYGVIAVSVPSNCRSANASVVTRTCIPVFNRARSCCGSEKST